MEKLVVSLIKLTVALSLLLAFIVVQPTHGISWADKLVPFQVIFDALRRKKSSAAVAGSGTNVVRRGRVVGGISLVGAGFGRTGTTSIERALNQLGYKIYDSVAMVEHNHGRQWAKAANDWKLKGNLTGIELLLSEIERLGYTVTLDMPMNFFASAFAELRPGAKVLLSVRDSVEKWVASLEFVFDTLVHRFCVLPWRLVAPELDAIWEMFSLFTDYPMVPPTYPDHIARPVPWFEYVYTNPNFTPEGRNAWAACYRKHREHFERSITPRERLLVFNVKQGWKPLVPFLNLNLDENELGAFPFVNDRSTLKLAIATMDFIALGMPFWICLTLWVMLHFSRFVLRLLGASSLKKSSKAKAD
uniref:Sulfotransferase domain-containing protein n=1 Tax=Odontella aurita TaxID=265563 RepID=A0A7S4HT83_9STRA|mmetsp:Transcript_14884/g.43381  ORF Transcript_14884/g.43381 Transcript_14884/m.43381 type:complete len:360 (+) Transcript_14884:76-1155(+)